MRLILASSSRYRQHMLGRLGIPFQAISPNIDESPLPGETPIALALRLSIEKAAAVAPAHPGALVIGSDQVATLHGHPIGKPGNYENAYAQLSQLSGQTVEFHSALCVSDGQRQLTDNVVTLCQFRTLQPDEITQYLHREQPWDTAGSAKAESLGIALMDSMRSDDPTAIIGLPLIALSRMLRSFNVNPLTYTTAEQA
ncbi:MAG: septum formation protein Maf [Burkholderiaceae bacterium]|nr:septum formation protein Maf [Burkholderiaceae bacterium]